MNCFSADSSATANQDFFFYILQHFKPVSSKEMLFAQKLLNYSTWWVADKIFFFFFNGNSFLLITIWSPVLYIKSQGCWCLLIFFLSWGNYFYLDNLTHFQADFSCVCYGQTSLSYSFLVWPPCKKGNTDPKSMCFGNQVQDRKAFAAFVGCNTWSSV